ncbi:MAG: 3'(2'),5'-bisphosphate nucleotidase CysQ [Fimbriiglobus sp.]|jgi:3'(2'), 5'-bisphosphate nucleotidase|nr:3'(2'),5'-bisphosphate nucleotidase CysQ [Fimbriiglobus sp.]
MDYSHELREALAAAAAAGTYLAAEYAAFTAIPDAPAHISTHADRGAQEIILKHLHAAFPADGLVAEENTPTAALAPSDAPRKWVVDPIDGTKGFAIKNGEFSVMIGLTVGDRPVVGVVLEPALKRLTYAATGFGCWRKDGDAEAVQCHATSCDSLASATLTQSHSKPGKTKPVPALLAPAKVIETYSAGIKLAQVARGEADVYVNSYPEFHDWDVCAGEVLVIEAGGVVSEFDGGTVRYGQRGAKRRGGLVACGPQLHAAVVGKLR